MIAEQRGLLLTRTKSKTKSCKCVLAGCLDLHKLDSGGSRRKSLNGEGGG